MQTKAIIFDMDGTLMDSGRGLMKSIRAGLLHFGFPDPDEKTLRSFVGPPIRLTLQQYGVPEEQLPETMNYFRHIYSTVNRYETVPYPGMTELLETLQQRGHRLYVATSKPQDLTDDILGKFGLAGYFSFICGADWSQHRDTKDSVIRHLLKQLEPGMPRVMVGDTVFDVEGAAVFGIPTVGVAWGYGTEQELREAGAVDIAHTMQELLQLLEQKQIYKFASEN